jgi:hypothetical protein
VHMKATSDSVAIVPDRARIQTDALMGRKLEGKKSRYDSDLHYDVSALPKHSDQDQA